MAEAINPPLRYNSISDIHQHVNWGRALMAGLLATIAITISLALFGTNIMKSLGSMMLGPSSTATTQYVVGGFIHLVIGVGYGLVYAVLFGPVRRLSVPLKGAIFGLAITAIALAAMPVMAAMMGGGGGANPCNPCATKSTSANPCNPCAAKKPNPCNPCGAKSAAANPCNPCAAKKPNPCNPCDAKSANPSAGKKTKNPCAQAGAANPCNPCGGGGGGAYAGLISLVNHLIYGLTLALVYGRGGNVTEG